MRCSILQAPIRVTQIAKGLDLSGRELNLRLKAPGIQFRQGGTWLLTTRYQKEGYARTHTHSWQNRSGETSTAMHTVWTEKGRLFIHSLFNRLPRFLTESLLRGRNIYTRNLNL